MQHSLLGPSGAHRWLFCPGSVALERTMPDTTSSYADEGTAAHWLAATCLEQNKTAREPGMPEQYQQYDSEEFRDGVQAYLDYCRAIPGERFVEQRVTYEQWVPDGFGTADFFTINGEWLDIADLKFGKGVMVSAQDNWQGRLYAVGVVPFVKMLYPDVKYVRIHIVQPRLDFIDTEELTIESLLSMMPWVQERAELTQHPDAPRIPGAKQCRFCKARAVCRERANANIALAAEEFGELPAPGQLSADDLSYILTRLDEFDAWSNAVRTHCFNLALQGSPPPGFKMVEGRSNRVWASEESVAFELSVLGFTDEQIYKKKVVGIGAVESLLGSKKKGKEFLTQHTFKPQGSPTMVAESDPRSPIVKAEPAEDFEDIPDNPRQAR